MISFDDFSKLDLRVGKILEVAEHPNADKLYVLKVDLGEKTIQLVAGVKQWYAPADLEGKLGIVVTNMEPKALRGVESQGMLLVAQTPEGGFIISPEKEVAPGSKIR